MHLGLRGKLGLGFGGLLLVLVVLAAASLGWLARLGGSIEVILRENFRSVLAAQEMKEALERMDSGALFALTGDPEQGRTLAQVYGERFDRALAQELANVTLPGEGERATHAGEVYAEYRRTLEAVLDTARPLEERRALYYSALLPRFQEIKRLADEILAMNQQNMAEANVRARQEAARARQQMFVLVLVGTLFTAACLLFLGRAILGPLGRMIRSVEEVERGHYELVLAVPSRDELGQLAEAFNAMASRLRTLRRSDQARLARAQQISQLTINSLPEPVALLAPGGEVELANRAASALLGLRLGQQVPARHREWLEPLIEAAEPSGAPGRMEGYARALQLFWDGQERFFLPQVVAIRDGELGSVGTAVILVDVTELRRLDEMKSNLVATVSHELMTPLTSLAMALHVLLEERLAPLAPEQVELLVGAREDADRLRRILEGLLDVSRLEAGKTPLELLPTPVAELVAEAVEPLRPVFADRGVALEVELPAELPRVLADSTRAALVLTNFLTNALKHTASGGTVRVEAALREDKVRLAVADDGPGIAPEHLPRLFEKFFRIPGESAPGAGLGLAIAREIAEAHGGEVGAESTPGSGATFWVELPSVG